MDFMKMPLLNMPILEQKLCYKIWKKWKGGIQGLCIFRVQLWFVMMKLVKFVDSCNYDRLKGNCGVNLSNIVKLITKKASKHKKIMDCKNF
mmetsp:Transcript_28743/g.37727  ORF Transcript_28743/g.37727 Transcript_28743/m.37727 type:complete len:91 (+) Transcript_28743:2249-2521(+)